MPDSGQLPERMATRALAEPTLWDAGTHLMQRASPASWEGIVAAVNLARDNRETIEACRTSAVKAKQPVRCTIEVKPANNGPCSPYRCRFGQGVAPRPRTGPPHPPRTEGHRGGKEGVHQLK